MLRETDTFGGAGACFAGFLAAEVVELLGDPDEERDYSAPGRYEGYDDEYEEAGRSGSSCYLLWRRRGVVYTVGFDGEEYVTVKRSVPLHV
jgi:hypothetical protein